MSHRCNRKGLGGVVIVYVRWYSQLTIKHKLPEDIKSVFVEVNLRKTKWLILGAHRPLCQSVEYFFKHVRFALDTYRQTY